MVSFRSEFCHVAFPFYRGIRDGNLNRLRHLRRYALVPVFNLKTDMVKKPKHCMITCF